VEWKLELAAILVSDVDRAKAFYTEPAGFRFVQFVFSSDTDGNGWSVQQPVSQG